MHLQRSTQYPVIEAVSEKLAKKVERSIVRRANCGAGLQAPISLAPRGWVGTIADRRARRPLDITQ